MRKISELSILNESLKFNNDILKCSSSIEIEIEKLELDLINLKSLLTTYTDNNVCGVILESIDDALEVLDEWKKLEFNMVKCFKNEWIPLV
jgi:hypothetical protein